MVHATGAFPDEAPPSQTSEYRTRFPSTGDKRRSQSHDGETTLKRKRSDSHDSSHSSNESLGLAAELEEDLASQDTSTQDNRDPKRRRFSRSREALNSVDHAFATKTDAPKVATTIPSGSGSEIPSHVNTTLSMHMPGPGQSHQVPSIQVSEIRNLSSNGRDVPTQPEISDRTTSDPSMEAPLARVTPPQSAGSTSEGEPEQITPRAAPLSESPERQGQGEESEDDDEEKHL